MPSPRANKDKYKNLGKKKELELAEMAIELGIKITIDGSRVYDIAHREMTRDALEAAVRTNLRVKATPAEAGPGDPVDREKTAGRTAAPSRAGPSRGLTDRAEAGQGDPAGTTSASRAAWRSRRSPRKRTRSRPHAGENAADQVRQARGA